MLGLISTKGTDLLFGEEPEIRVDVPEQQDAITDIGERCSMHVLGAVVLCRTAFQLIRLYRLKGGRIL